MEVQIENEGGMYTMKGENVGTIQEGPIELKAQTQLEKVKEITARLEHGVQNLFESNRYKEYLNVISKFHNYSTNNLMLIHMQKPNASLIAGYNSWKNLFGRQVSKGEKGIKILAPSPYKVKRKIEKTDPQTHKTIIGENGKPVTEEIEVTVPAFKVVSVFDVSQTYGRELPRIGVNELVGEVSGYENLFEAIKKSCPVPIEYENITTNAKGYCTKDRIALKEGMSQIQNIKTVIHELAHHKLHFDDNKSFQTRNSKEVEAESVAYTICQHYGIDTSEYSFGYIAGWSAGKKMDELKESLYIIQKASSEIITEIDKHIDELRIEKEASQKNTDINKNAVSHNKDITITCEWSEHNAFEGRKTYSVLEFDTLMKKANEEWITNREAELKTWGSEEDVLNSVEINHQGYAKVKFTVNLPDGQKITERQDVGDFNCGVIDFFRSFESYNNEQIAEKLDGTAARDKQRMAATQNRPARPSVIRNLHQKQAQLSNSENRTNHKPPVKDAER